MSQFSKVNETLRKRILRSLEIYSKTNKQLFFSSVANPYIISGECSEQTYSLRTIQEATQKLLKIGVLSLKTGTKNVYEVNKSYTATA